MLLLTTCSAHTCSSFNTEYHPPLDYEQHVQFSVTVFGATCLCSKSTGTCAACDRIVLCMQLLTPCVESQNLARGCVSAARAMLLPDPVGFLEKCEACSIACLPKLISVNA
eukprot:3734314-Amphidinium_carterae.1